MLNKLRSFTNTKLAGVLIAIIIVPFVFWGMGSVFSGGNTNNVAKINNDNISTKDFINYINQTRMDSEYIKKNINNNVIENILSQIISKELLDKEIESLNIIISDESLVNIIKKNEVFLDDSKNFSRIKYEKFLLENHLTAPEFEIKFKSEELKKNLFNYVSGGVKSPMFLANKIYLNENKNIEIEYFNLNFAYDNEASTKEIEDYIKNNEEMLKEDYIDFAFSKITPKELISIDEFNNEFFKKIDEIENSILNGSNINDIKSKYNLKIEYFNYYKGDQNNNEILNEIYSKRNKDKIQLIEKNDYFLLFEISKIEKILSNLDNPDFKKKVKDNIIEKKRFELTKDIFEKIQERKFNDTEFLKISNNIENIKITKITSIDDNDKFDTDSVKLIYSMPKDSFLLITDNNKDIYLAKIIDILYEHLSEKNKEIEIYKFQSLGNIKSNILSTYDSTLNKKYKVKVFESTLDRIKNNF